MTLLYIIMVIIIVILIAKLSAKENENLELLSRKCRDEVYEEYKRKPTKFLRKELAEISKEYHDRLDYYVARYREDHGSECVTPFGFDSEKCVYGGKGYMSHNKDDMMLYHRYNVIDEILDRRNKDD